MGYTESEHQSQASPSYLDGKERHSCKTFFSGILLILLLVFPSKHATAQRKSDIGIIGGASYYMGDINAYDGQLTGVELGVSETL